MTDAVYEQARKSIQAAIHAAVESNDKALERVRLEGIYGAGDVWSTEELTQEFEIRGFAAPFCVVRRRADGVHGTVEFQHSPRLYFSFQQHQVRG